MFSAWSTQVALHNHDLKRNTLTNNQQMALSENVFALSNTCMDEIRHSTESVLSDMISYIDVNGRLLVYMFILLYLQQPFT